MNEFKKEEEFMGAKVRILYCPDCGWMLRATWIAQEILSTFTNELNTITLEPAKEHPGVFQVWAGKKMIWCRKSDQGFPQPKELKKRLRDTICPERGLGHLDK